MKNIAIVLQQESDDQSMQARQLERLLKSNEAIALLGNLSRHRIDVLVLKPALPDKPALDYFRKEIFPKLPKDGYAIYIGSGVADVTELSGGVEIPYGVLETQERFREEVLYRIRRLVGSPSDN